MNEPADNDPLSRSSYRAVIILSSIIISLAIIGTLLFQQWTSIRSFVFTSVFVAITSGTGILLVALTAYFQWQGDQIPKNQRRTTKRHKYAAYRLCFWSFLSIGVIMSIAGSWMSHEVGQRKSDLQLEQQRQAILQSQNAITELQDQVRRALEEKNILKVSEIMDNNAAKLRIIEKDLAIWAKKTVDQASISKSTQLQRLEKAAQQHEILEIEASKRALPTLDFTFGLLRRMASAYASNANISVSINTNSLPANFYRNDEIPRTLSAYDRINAHMDVNSERLINFSDKSTWRLLFRGIRPVVSNHGPALEIQFYDSKKIQTANLTLVTAANTNTFELSFNHRLERTASFGAQCSDWEKREVFIVEHIQNALSQVLVYPSF